MQINSNINYQNKQYEDSSKMPIDNKFSNTIIEYENWPYYFNNPEAKLVSYKRYKFFKEQEQLPWEDRLAHPDIAAFPKTCDFDLDEIAHQWLVALKDVTNSDKYNDAPKFEAFVKKWMKKGYSEFNALQRASIYIDAGLLDYGKQRALFLANLPTEDIKQHAMWLIYNPPLKQAIIKIFDSLDSREAASLEHAIFHGGAPSQYKNLNFKDLLEQYGVKLEDLKKTNSDKIEKSKYTFTGDINLKNSISYNNFIFDTLIDYFKDLIKRIEKFEKNNNESCELQASVQKNINKFINIFQEEVNKYNEKR